MRRRRLKMQTKVGGCRSLLCNRTLPTVDAMPKDQRHAAVNVGIGNFCNLIPFINSLVTHDPERQATPAAAATAAACELLEDLNTLLNPKPLMRERPPAALPAADRSRTTCLGWNLT